MSNELSPFEREALEIPTEPPLNARWNTLPDNLKIMFKLYTSALLIGIGTATYCLNVTHPTTDKINKYLWNTIFIASIMIASMDTEAEALRTFRKAVFWKLAYWMYIVFFFVSFFLHVWIDWMGDVEEFEFTEVLHNF